MQEYAARVCSDGRVQTVKEHTVGVWEKAESDAALMGVASIAKLVCLLHDMGKNTAYSNEYQHTLGHASFRACRSGDHVAPRYL